jgi:pSer/pThr/pTyr-binding forkhead associated (FHA) protein
MRLSFLNGEHADFVVADGVISLGQADGNTLVLTGRDIAPWHARINVDQRGIVLEVLDFASRTHVNARPVREKALLRLGDVLCLGVVAMMLKPDRDDVIDTTLPPELEDDDDVDGAPARVVLRGVSGSHFGRALALRQRLVVGRAADCDIVVDDAQIAPHHATIEAIGETICLRDMGSGAGSLVNGLRLATAVLHAGDQIAFGREHFVIEAPGLPLRGEVASAPNETALPDADAAESPSSSAGDARGSIWWLIGSAALIALGLAWILLRGA